MGNKDRYAPIGQRALAWVDRYLAQARPKLTQDPAQPLLFVTAKGNKVHSNDLSSRVRRCMNQAGVTKVGACHLFRHSAATFMHAAGADIRHIQAILGHESLNTTQIYTHVSIGKLCEVHAKTHPGRLTRSDAERSHAGRSEHSLRSLLRRPLASARRLLVSVVRRRSKEDAKPGPS